MVQARPQRGKGPGCATVGSWESTMSHTRKIARNASVVAGATLLSRVLGFVRDVVIAFALGAGPLADSFFVAFRLPNLLRRLFAEGSLTMAFVPVFTRSDRFDGQDEAFAVARSTALWLLLLLGLLMGVAIVAARPLTLVIAPGFADTPEVVNHTALLVRICFPYILFISGVALCMGILNARDHFLAPALAPCVLNAVLITASLAAVALGWPVPTTLAWAVLVAGLGQWLLQQPFLRRQGFSWFGPASLRHPGVLRIGRLMLPTVVGAAVYQLNIVLGTVLASFLSLGSISFLYYADRLVQFPLGVFGIAVSQAALPSFSRLAADGAHEDLLQTLNKTLGLLIFISLPSAAGLIALSEPMVATLFGRGAFSAEAVQATAWALVGYSTGLPAFCCVRSLVSTYYALEDTKTPVKIATLCLLLNGGLGLLLMQFWAHVGLALAVALASWANVVLLLRGLRAHFNGPWMAVPGVVRMLGLSLLVGVGAWVTAGWGGWALLGIPFWAAVYLGAAGMLGMPETELFFDGTRQVLRRVGKR